MTDPAENRAWTNASKGAPEKFGAILLDSTIDSDFKSVEKPSSITWAPVRSNGPGRFPNLATTTAYRRPTRSVDLSEGV